MIAREDLREQLDAARDDLNRFQVAVKALADAADQGAVIDEAEVLSSRLAMVRYRVRMMGHGVRLFISECRLIHNRVADEREAREAAKSAPPDAPPEPPLHPGA